MGTHAFRLTVMGNHSIHLGIKLKIANPLPVYSIGDVQCRAPEGKAAELPGRGERWLGWVSARRNGAKPRGSGDLGKLLAADAGELLEIYAEGTFVLQLVAHRFLIAQQTQPDPRRPAALRLFGGSWVGTR